MCVNATQQAARRADSPHSSPVSAEFGVELAGGALSVSERLIIHV